MQLQEAGALRLVAPASVFSGRFGLSDTNIRNFFLLRYIQRPQGSRTKSHRVYRRGIACRSGENKKCPGMLQLVVGFVQCAPPRYTFLECVPLSRLLGHVQKTCPAVGHVQTRPASVWIFVKTDRKGVGSGISSLCQLSLTSGDRCARVH